MAGSYPHDNIVGVGLWTGTGAFETLAAVTDSHVVVDDDAGLKAAFAAVATQICTPKLTLTKHVENAPNGENAGSWTLIASGTSDEEFVSGVEESVAPDTYTLSETGPTEGWSDGGWSCTNATEGGTDVSGGSPVTLALGDDVTCEITNTYTPREPDPDLKVEKDDPSITYNDAGSVTATFKITVTNLTDQETEYELEDVEQFWDGYTVVSGPDLVFDDDASDEPDAVVEPTGDAASGTLVGLSDVHIYTATFEISGEMNVYGPGDGEFNDWSYCDGDGSGLWNGATDLLGRRAVRRLGLGMRHSRHASANPGQGRGWR